MAHSAVWGHSPTQRQNSNSKKVMIEKLSIGAVAEDVKSLVELIQTITLSLIMHFI